MRSAIRAVLTGLKIQRTTVFASDFDDLSKNLGVGRSGIGFLLEPAHRSHHDQHDSNQHDEEWNPDGEKIRRVKHNHQDWEDEQEHSSEAGHLGIRCSGLFWQRYPRPRAAALNWCRYL